MDCNYKALSLSYQPLTALKTTSHQGFSVWPRDPRSQGSNHHDPLYLPGHTLQFDFESFYPQISSTGSVRFQKFWPCTLVATARRIVVRSAVSSYNDPNNSKTKLSDGCHRMIQNHWYILLSYMPINIVWQKVCTVWTCLCETCTRNRRGFQSHRDRVIGTVVVHVCCSRQSSMFSVSNQPGIHLNVSRVSCPTGSGWNVLCSTVARSPFQSVSRGRHFALRRPVRWTENHCGSISLFFLKLHRVPHI